MEQIHDVKNWQFLCWATIAISTIIKAYYYLKIKHDNSFIGFIMDSFFWVTSIGINNSEADNTRKKYMQVNNKCMLILWLSLLVQLILLFF